MANVVNKNPDFPDIFLGAREDSGTFKNKDGEEVAYHSFILNFALADVVTNKNTVSQCGFEVLGMERKGDDFKDWRKVKADDMAKIFGTQIFTAEQLNSEVFQNCDVVFDRNGNIRRVNFETPLTAASLDPATGEIIFPNEQVEETPKSKK